MRLLAAAGEEDWTTPAGLELPVLPDLGVLSTRVGEAFVAAEKQLQGPTSRSNWLVPGMVLAGDRTATESDEKVQALLRQGITTFVNLQSRGEGQDYRPRVLKLNPSARFLSLPIPDRLTTSDAQVSRFVLDLASRLLEGEVLYVHCRGGHGRTGTVCSLLLGLLYELRGGHALALYQALHDLRQQPVFAAAGYEVSADGRSCVALFGEQKAQVLRLLPSADAPAAAAAWEAAAGAEEEAAAVAGLPPHRSASEEYGAGASAYSAEALEAWKARGEEGAAAARRGEWARAVTALKKAAALRPDWAKGYVCLGRALRRLWHAGGGSEEQRGKAAAYLEQGAGRCGEASRAEILKEAALLRNLTPQPSRVKAAAAEAGAGQQAGAVPLPPRRSASAEAAAAAVRAVVEEAAEQEAVEAAVATATDAAVAAWGAAAGPSAPAAEAPAAEAAEAAAAAAPAARKGAARRGNDQLPPLVMLVGLPGAGKSTFASALLASAPDEWDYVCQDEVGSRSGVEAAVGRHCKPGGKRLLLDRCNVSAADRKAFLELALRPAGAVAVFLNVPRGECEARVAARTAHPTIRYGGGKRAVAAMAQALTPPSTAEGFARVHVLRSKEEVEARLRAWGASPPEPAPQGFFKFPRTRHLLNTGGSAVSRDDIVLSAGEAAQYFDGTTVVVAEEKVDGANLGLSLTKDYEVQAQNRSHFVCSQTHAQFRPLGQWIDEHSWALCQLLVPEEEVLFGEWCYARHSVHYSRLPGYFLAFDIYNKRTATFVSADERQRRMAGLPIPQVHRVAARAFRSKEELLALLETQSRYADRPLEGVYLRIDDEGAGGVSNVRRAKLVRPDFIQAIDAFWTAGGLVKNEIDLAFDAEPEEESVR